MRRSKGAIRKFCESWSSCPDCGQVPGENQIIEPYQLGGAASQGLGEDQTLESSLLGGGASPGLGEDQTLESSQPGGGASLGANCVCKAWDVDTLCTCGAAGKEFDLVPGKTVHTKKAFTGRLCGNFLSQSVAREQKYAAKPDGVLIRLVLREAAMRGWRIGVLDVKTAFLLAPLLFQEQRPTLVLAPKLFLLAGVCKEPTWRVQVMGKLRGRTAAGEVGLVPSGVGTFELAVVELCYVDDLLIAAEPGIAEEVARMFTTIWKCTEPQWDEVTFNGFQICATPEVPRIATSRTF